MCCLANHIRLDQRGFVFSKCISLLATSLFNLDSKNTLCCAVLLSGGIVPVLDSDWLS